MLWWHSGSMRRIRLLAALVLSTALALPAAASAYGSYGWYMPQMSWCGSYYAYGGCPAYTSYNYSPYMYANSYASAGAYTDAGRSSAYAYARADSYAPSYYPYYMTYQSSYPQYQMNYQQPYYQQYQTQNYYQPSHQGNSYQDQYCYSGYGCYPMHVSDPHQWNYDPWTGTWY